MDERASLGNIVEIDTSEGEGVYQLKQKNGLESAKIQGVLNCKMWFLCCGMKKQN